MTLYIGSKYVRDRDENVDVLRARLKAADAFLKISGRRASSAATNLSISSKIPTSA